MEPTEAIKLIREHEAAVIKAVHANDNPQGRGVITAMRGVHNTSKALFVAITGRKPTDEEMKAIEL